MLAQTRRLRALVERLMTLARLQDDEAPSLEPVDVVEVARDVVAALSVARSAPIALHDASSFGYVRANSDELHDAIVNLVDNATKYGRGSVIVEIANEDARVVVRVHDDGPGIAEADRTRVFDRFFRGENAVDVDGSGLGLAIARRAAERAGGTVAVETTGPSGTTFRLSLPAYRDVGTARESLILG